MRRGCSDTYINVRDDDEAIVLTVRSLGPRIEVDEIERIFDVFYRGAAARALGTEGTGFGLALASNIATHMGTGIRGHPRIGGNDGGLLLDDLLGRLPSMV